MAMFNEVYFICKIPTSFTKNTENQLCLIIIINENLMDYVLPIKCIIVTQLSAYVYYYAFTD